MQTVYLDPNQVPAALRGSYAGKHFKANVCESVTIPADAGLWEGGSRDRYEMAKDDWTYSSRESDFATQPNGALT